MGFLYEVRARDDEVIQPILAVSDLLRLACAYPARRVSTQKRDRKREPDETRVRSLGNYFVGNESALAFFRRGRSSKLLLTLRAISFRILL
jgi:hypothetical protein